MIQSEKLKEHARRLRLYNIANRMDSILHHAQEEKPTYSEFLSLVLGCLLYTSLVRENLGDLILTRTFRAFVNEQHFQPVFCRPADPESKRCV